LVVADSEPLGLVEFLADLRHDLSRAQQQAAAQAQAAATAGNEALWLGVEEVTVTLEVAHERTVSGETSGKVGGKFWVFASAEASVTAGGESKRSGTQTLTLTLKPRLEMTVTDAQGRSETASRGVDVEGQLVGGEQPPPLPGP
jgi:Trypsin-co-occurring domain 2